MKKIKTIHGYIDSLKPLKKEEIPNKTYILTNKEDRIWGFQCKEGLNENEIHLHNYQSSVGGFQIMDIKHVFSLMTDPDWDSYWVRECEIPDDAIVYKRWNT